MKKLTIITLLLCFTIQAMSAEKVYLISPLVKVTERELPKELSRNYLSYSQYYLSQTPKTRNVDLLLKEFESAQKYYLVKSFDFARTHYTRVIEMMDLDEWKDLHRKVIYLSFIRLAEVEPGNQIQWIRKALRFSLDIDPSKLEISKGMLKTIKNVKKGFSNEVIRWEVGSLKSDFKYILINGHTVDLSKIETIKVPSGQFRVTFLSDIYKPQTYQIGAQQIPLLVPTRIPFVSGTCEKPSHTNEGEIDTDVILYYSKDCLKSKAGRNWIAYGPGKEQMSITHYEPQNQLSPDLVSKVESRDEPFYKNKWFLISLGVLATSAAIYASKNKNEKPTHETVSGY